MSTVTDLNGNLALLGGISGLAFLIYFVLMIYFARRKDQHVQEIQVQLARIEGILIGRKR